MEYGILSVLPTLLVLVTAIIFRRVLEPLLLGTVVGFIIIAGSGFFGSWVDAVYTVMFGETWVWILLVTMLFGAQIALLDSSGATLRFSEIATKVVKNKKSSLLASWVLGLALFIDDYLNALTVGASMRKITDKFKVPREMLCYVADATAGPMAILTPFTAWAFFFMGMLGDLGIDETLGRSTFEIYVSSIPYMVYGFVALIIVPLAIIKVVPPLGPMKKAWERVESTGDVFPEDTDLPEEDTTTQNIPKNPKLYYFIVPIVILVGGTIIMDGDLVSAVLISIAATVAMLVVDRALKWEEIYNTFIKGMESMVMVMTLMLLAFVLLEANEQLGFAEYVIHSVQPWMSENFLPAIAFVVVGAMAFASGSLWGIAAISMPIILPLAEALDVNLYLATGAVVSGAVFGSHCCFYTDATILASRSCQIKPIDHALTQIPYGLIGAAISIVIYILLGIML